MSGVRVVVSGFYYVEGMRSRCVPGSIQSVGKLVEFYDPETVLLVTGGASFERSGAADAVLPALAECTVERVHGVSADPTLDDLNTAIERFRGFDPDIVVAVGGGSVIDLAKSVRTLGPLAADARPFWSGAEDIEDPDVPLIAIPTTAGTGSEATRYVVIAVDGVKLPLADPALIPSDVILDPDLLTSVPPHVAASTGLDALAQAMEAMWSVRSSASSHAVARRSLELSVASIVDAVGNPDSESRMRMMDASHLAGIAIDTSPTTAPHAFSFRITMAHGVPHGHAVALTLGPTLEYNAAVTDDDCQHPMGVAHVRSVIDEILAILDVPDASAGRTLLTDLIAELGLEPTLEGVGASSFEARKGIAFSPPPSKLLTNPRRFDEASQLHLIREIA